MWQATVRKPVTTRDVHQLYTSQKLTPIEHFWMWSLVKVLVPRKSRRCRTRVQQAARASREADDKKGPRAGVTVLSLIVPHLEVDGMTGKRHLPVLLEKDWTRKIHKLD